MAAENPEERSQPPSPAQDVPEGVVYGIDEKMANRRAECDGGSVSEDGLAAREDFAGTLTGEYWETGDPPWRWYYMNRLTKKPPYFEGDAVWCETGFLFLVDE